MKYLILLLLWIPLLSVSQVFDDFNEFDFDYILLEPAITINFRLANFFVGAGLTKFFELGDDFWANKFSLKVQY